MICQLCKAPLQENGVCQDLYNQVAFYTLNQADPVWFIHQLVVDAYGAQHATENSKPIAVAFALIGLYLFSEKQYTGRQVQLAHMQLANPPAGGKREYPRFVLPKNRGELTAGDVLKIKEGKERDRMIKKWATSTWQAFIENRSAVINLLKEAEFKDIK